MKKFITSLVCFAVIVGLLAAGYWNFSSFAATKYNGPTVKQRIDKSFADAMAGDYNCYILGNSKTVRAFNPDKLTAVNAYNFGHDNDSFNQMYYKLKYLLDGGKQPEYVIAGVDYFQFSFLSNTRNYAYEPYFGADYMADFTLYDRVDAFLYQWMTKQHLWYQCIEYLTGVSAPEQIDHKKDNGQYVTYGTATESDTSTRSAEVLDVQKGYFEKLVELCEENDIELIMVMVPTRDVELAGYSEEDIASFDDIDAMIEETISPEYAGNYYNYKDLAELKDYTHYTDAMHLNEESSDCFSEIFNEEVLIPMTEGEK